MDGLNLHGKVCALTETQVCFSPSSAQFVLLEQKELELALD